MENVALALHHHSIEFLDELGMKEKTFTRYKTEGIIGLCPSFIVLEIKS